MPDRKPPRPIRWFERLALLSLAVGIPGSALSFRQTVAASGASPAFVVTAQTAVFATLLLIVLAISRRGSNIARWLYVLLLVSGIAMMMPRLGALYYSGAAGLIQIAQIFLQLASAYFLFAPGAPAWFARGASRDG